MTTYIELEDESPKNRKAKLFNGKIESGGIDRNYKNIVNLENDISENEENTNDYIKVDGEINTNSLSISCWVNLKGTSSRSAGIVTNLDEDNNRSGLIINSNGNQFSLGYVWDMNVDISDYDFDITISKEQWTHLVLIVYKSGIARLFVNGIYKSVHDCGYIRNNVLMKNIEIGRFSGLIDNVKFFSDTLDYGNVKLNEPASDDILFLYNQNKSEFKPISEENINYVQSLKNSFIRKNNGMRFYYVQSSEYVKAHESYLENTLKYIKPDVFKKTIIENQDYETQDEQKFTIQSNDPRYDGIRKFAEGNFRTISGEIVDSL